MPKPTTKRQKPTQPALDDPSGCICSSLRRTTRAITQIYDEALEPHGLTSSQFCVLAEIEKIAPVTVQRLAGLLGMDRTTLTRVLAPLSRDRLTRMAEGEDRRERHIELTPSGAQKLRSARPQWLKAQRQVMKAFGESESASLIGTLEAVRTVTGASEAK